MLKSFYFKSVLNFIVDFYGQIPIEDKFKVSKKVSSIVGETLNLLNHLLKTIVKNYDLGYPIVDDERITNMRKMILIIFRPMLTQLSYLHIHTC